MNLLINSYWCCPGMASEPGVAWRYIEGLSSRHDITVITGSRYRDQIIQANKNNVKFIFIDNKFHEKISAVGARFGLGAAFGGLYHYYWQVKVFLKIYAKGGGYRKDYDVFHHLNSFSWRWPPLLVFLFSKTIWGPIGGGQNIPTGLAGERGFYLNRIRPFLQKLSKYDPILNLCFWKATKIICANSDTFDLLPFWVRQKSSVRLETSIDVSDRCADAKFNNKRTKVILSIGNLIPLKGFDLVIKSMQKVVNSGHDSILKIVGEGGEKERLMKLASDLGIADKVVFLGRVPYQEINGYYRDADVFIWGSLQDTSGNVLLEAMSEGLPVVGIDTGGTRDIVSHCVTGIKVFPSSEKRVVDEMARAVCMLFDNPELNNWMSENSRKLVRDNYSWNGLVKYIDHEYSKLIN